MNIMNSFWGAQSSYNTYIGGAGATVTTAALLAAKLSIAEGDISNFTVSNNNIKCRINADYTFLVNAFSTDHNITYYIDFDGRATGCIANAFYDTINMKLALFPSLTSSTTNMFRCAASGTRSTFYAISLPVETPIGTDATNNANYTFVNVNNFYTHASNQTNNGGSPDGDLTNANAVFTNINYVSGDTNAPDAIDDLAASNISGSQLDLTWTAPASTNTIDLYVIFQDGVPIASTTSLSYTVTGLTELTSYGFEVLTFDQEGNCSSFSNLLTQATSAYVIPTGNIVSYWNFDSDSLDQVGVNDGTDTSMSYVSSGGIGNVADFTASTSSQISVADAANLSFGNGTTDSSFSVILMFKLTTKNQLQLIGKRDSSNNNKEYHLWLDNPSGNVLNFRLFDQSSGGQLNINYTLTPSLSTFYEVFATYNGSGLASGLKLYVNGVSVGTTSTSGTYTAMENGIGTLMFGKFQLNTTNSLNGYMDETAIFNKELSALEVYEIYLKHQSGQYLTE